MKNTLSLSLFITVVVLGGLELWHLSMSPAQVFSAAWKRDMKLLTEHNKLPQAFRSLRTVQLEGGDEASKHLIDHAQVPIETTEKGAFKLEILVTSFAQPSSWSTVLHYHLIEEASGNLIWELGRTLTFDSHKPEGVLAIEAASP